VPPPAGLRGWQRPRGRGPTARPARPTGGAARQPAGLARGVAAAGRGMRAPLSSATCSGVQLLSSRSFTSKGRGWKRLSSGCWPSSACSRVPWWAPGVSVARGGRHLGGVHAPRGRSHLRASLAGELLLGEELLQAGHLSCLHQVVQRAAAAGSWEVSRWRACKSR
jgi:hypothetical protein